jgi:hypothetical protein
MSGSAPIADMIMRHGKTTRTRVRQQKAPHLSTSSSERASSVSGLSFASRR